MLDIEMEYPSVMYVKFSDALYDAEYKLLEDPSADMNAIWALVFWETLVGSLAFRVSR